MVSVGIEPYASANRILPVNPLTPDRVMVAARDGDELLGHLCLTFDKGLAFGHDTVSLTDNKTVAARMWLYARKYLKSMGINEVFVHLEESTPNEIREFWAGRGFKQVLTVMKGDI